MPEFKFKAKDGRGNLVEDTIVADNQREVISSLHRRGLVVVDIETKRSKGKKSRSHKRVRVDDLAVFGRQLATMVNAGLPLIEGLRTLVDQTGNKGFQSVIADLVSQIESGGSFSDAVARHPLIFGTFFINMVRAGEASGELAEILMRVADYLESVNSFRRRLRGAMIYPVIIGAMALLITMVLLLKVIPVFEGIYADFDAQLPIPTMILIKLSAIVRQYFWLITMGVVAGIYVLVRFKKTKRGRFLYDKYKLRLPVLGELFRKIAITRFAQTLATLVESGVPILQAFVIVREVAGNSIIEQVVDKVVVYIEQGKTIEEPLRESGVFPVMVTKMIAVGEKTGRLEKMLQKISEYYQEQVSVMVAGLSSLIEPLLIAFLGVVVGGIVFSMFLPVFRLSSIIGAS